MTDEEMLAIWAAVKAEAGTGEAAWADVSPEGRMIWQLTHPPLAHAWIWIEGYDAAAQSATSWARFALAFQTRGGSVVVTTPLATASL